MPSFGSSSRRDSEESAPSPCSASKQPACPARPLGDPANETWRTVRARPRQGEPRVTAWPRNGLCNDRSASARMDFERVVERRFMCRRYEARDVPSETVDRILDLALRFPSAGHTQPQEFIVVRDVEVRMRLARAAVNQLYAAEAPLMIVVVSDTRRSKARYRERGEQFYSIVDGAFASMLILLAAVNEGLGAAFVGA